MSAYNFEEEELYQSYMIEKVINSTIEKPVTMNRLHQTVRDELNAYQSASQQKWLCIKRFVEHRKCFKNSSRFLFYFLFLSDKITSVVGGKVVLRRDFFRSSHEFKFFIICWLYQCKCQGKCQEHARGWWAFSGLAHQFLII